MDKGIKHLRYDVLAADKEEHPQRVMARLGVTYNHSTPQSMGDQWWFWNCENIPDNLPEYLSELNLNPMELIGYGLSKKDAEKIRDYTSG